MWPRGLSGTTYIISLHTGMHAICAEVFHREAVIVVILVSWRLLAVCLNVLGWWDTHAFSSSSKCIQNATMWQRSTGVLRCFMAQQPWNLVLFLWFAALFGWARPPLHPKWTAGFFGINSADSFLEHTSHIMSLFFSSSSSSKSRCSALCGAVSGGVVLWGSWRRSRVHSSARVTFTVTVWAPGRDPAPACETGSPESWGHTQLTLLSHRSTPPHPHTHTFTDSCGFHAPKNAWCFVFSGDKNFLLFHI